MEFFFFREIPIRSKATAPREVLVSVNAMTTCRSGVVEKCSI